MAKLTGVSGKPNQNQNQNQFPKSDVAETETDALSESESEPTIEATSTENQVIFGNKTLETEAAAIEEFERPTSEDVALLKDTSNGQPPIPFEWNNKTAESYSKQGFKVPAQYGNDSQEIQFLSKIRPNEWENIIRTVTKMVRVMAIDYESEKLQRREFLYYYENWTLKNDENNIRPDEIPPVTDHVEGKYLEQERKPLPPVNGRIPGYKRTGSHEVHYIKFSKEKVDEIIASSVGTDRDNIIYVIKNGPVRDDKFTYDQFLNLGFTQGMEAIRTPGGPEMHAFKNPNVANVAKV